MTPFKGGTAMYEHKYQVGIRHKVTGEELTLEVWAENTDAATYKLTGTLIGPYAPARHHHPGG